MIKSMTGFGYNEFAGNDIEFFINIKSVNSRFLDIKINLPQELMHFEEKIMSLINQYLNRGKVEVAMWTENLKNLKRSKIEVNMPLLKEYLSIMEQIKTKFNLESNVSFNDILKINGILKISNQTQYIEYNKNIEKGIIKAIQNLNRMREREGKILYKNFIFILKKTLNDLKKIKNKLPGILKKYEERMRRKVNDLIDSRKYDENRILMEVALLADKMDINEEIERIKSHIIQMDDYLKSDNPCGRQMEFLLQEMLREINTVGSKVCDIDVTRNVITVKDCIEKLKEQVRNIV
ncbi:MAG: YicC family protein [Spirochaetes bacterium]|nr:YicC family protein [Spirochaetota bacterium]